MVSTRKKILIFTEKYLSISETFIYDQICSLEKHLDVQVVCIDVEHEDIYDTQNKICLSEGGNPNLFIKIGRALVKRNIYLGIGTRKYTKRFSHVMDDLKPDYILIHYGKSVMAIKNALVKWKGPIFIYFHGYDASMLLKQSYTYRKAISHFLGHRYVYAIFVSEALKNSFLNYFNETEFKYEVIKLGIDSNQFSRTSYTLNNNMIQVGRLVEKKGHLFTLQALKILCEKGRANDVHFTIIGDGPLLLHIRHAIKNMSLEQMVTIHTQVSKDKIRSYLNESKLFIQHSITSHTGDMEGLPIAIMEAMSMEMPIVSTKHSGIPELVEDSKNGYLSDEGNVEQFANNIEKAINMSYITYNRNKILVNHNIDIQTALLVKYMSQCII